MLQLQNNTPFRARLAALPSLDGADTLIVMVKASVDLSPAAAHREPDPIHLTDRYHARPDASSIAIPADLSLAKPATDILITGHACAREERPTTAMTVTAMVGPMTKSMRVIGDRTWRSGWWSPHATAPDPFVRMPLTWEHAYGGRDQPRAANQPETIWHDNPIGRGFRLRRSALPIDGQRLPNLVFHPDERPVSPHQPVRSTGLSALAPSWRPRQQWAGTYDETWQSTRAPFLPTDFNARFFQLAPDDQVVERLDGGEPIRLEGFAPEGPLEGLVPQARIRTVADVAGRQERMDMRLDTLAIDADRRVVSVLWRGCLQAENRLLKIRTVTIERDIAS